MTDEGTTGYLVPAVLPVIQPPDLPEAIARLEASMDVIVGMGDDPLDHAQSTGWQIENLSQAEWAMRVRNAAARRVEEHQQALRDFTEQLERWYVATTATDRATVRTMEWFLEDYQRRRREADDAAATLKLPSGRVRSTRYKPQVHVEDEDAVIAWLRANGHGDLVVSVTTEKVPVKALRDVVRPHVERDEDGTIIDTYAVAVNGDGEQVRVDGCSVSPESIDVKVNANA